MRPRGMLRAAAVAASVATIAACGAGQQRATGGGAPEIGTATQVSSIQIDASRVTELSVPVNVTMKPIERVAYAQVEKGPTTPNFQFVTVGSTWFDRTSDGLLARHVQ